MNPWVPICFELFSVFPGAKNMFAQCVGILASSLTSRRIRFKLVMMGVGERSLVNLADWIKLWQFCSSSREKVLIHSYCRPDLSASIRASRTRILACTIPANIWKPAFFQITNLGYTFLQPKRNKNLLILMLKLNFRRISVAANLEKLGVSCFSKLS